MSRAVAGADVEARQWSSTADHARGGRTTPGSPSHATIAPRASESFMLAPGTKDHASSGRTTADSLLSTPMLMLVGLYASRRTSSGTAPSSRASISTSLAHASSSRLPLALWSVVRV
eukprot:scaffold257909_cov27-Tisochrysis_lutea.AAC.1